MIEWGNRKVTYDIRNNRNNTIDLKEILKRLIKLIIIKIILKIKV